MSSAVLLFVGAAAIGSTGAFFSDTETSSGNTFAAGAIDLKVDNHSYYNGNECREVSPGVFQWQGSSTFPQPGTACDTSWDLTDLTIQKFFDFLDLKPGDSGEDTVSLHINNNDAYLCANVKLTSNDDNGYSEPELLVDPTVSTSTNGVGLGELASNVNFIMWADDGDNVLESNEQVLYEGPIGALGTNGSTTIPLADSATNIWNPGQKGGPAPGGITQYIGKAWCFGTITPAPLPQDGLGTTSPRTPGNSSGGYTCDGSQLDNSTQTDSLTADITFEATQARNNPGFTCIADNQPHATLTVTKIVVNNNGGNKQVSDFHLAVFDGFVSTPVTSGWPIQLPPGTYNVSESGPSGYVGSFEPGPGQDCDAEGNVTLTATSSATCILTNTELPANITLNKVVSGTPPLLPPSAFTLRVDGVKVQAGLSHAVTSNTPHTITEDAVSGYSFAGFVSASSSPECPAVLGGTAMLSEGQAITCTIMNHKN